MGQKGTGRRLSDQERIEIITKLEGEKPRASAAECARQYGVSSAAITKLMKMKEKIKQRFQENNTFSQQRKRGGTERHAAFEDELFQWITAQQQVQVPTLDLDQLTVVPPPMPLPLTSSKVQEKAHELLKIHNLGSFRASKGWYYRFCRRYGLSRTSLSAEEGEQDDDDHGVEHGGSESEDSMDDGEGRGPRKKIKTEQGWAVQSLQETLAKAAMALDHPEARQYLGEPAACEMLRSIQQSIGVVQCIRLKKAASEGMTEVAETHDDAVETTDVVDHFVELETEASASAEEDATVVGNGPVKDVIV